MKRDHRNDFPSLWRGSRGLRAALLLAVCTIGLQACDRTADSAPSQAGAAARVVQVDAGEPGAVVPMPEHTELAVFAAGCFWCVEEAFDQVDGVVETTSGYTGGSIPDPSYREVSSGRTGHYEAVAVRYDPTRVDYETLLATFWRNVDPTDDGGQFCDRGDSYRPAIFVSTDEQGALAAASHAALTSDAEAPQPIVVPILAAKPFYAAEDYHQDYYRKNPLRYRYYKGACGRVARLAEVWGDAPVVAATR